MGIKIETDPIFLIMCKALKEDIRNMSVLAGSTERLYQSKSFVNTIRGYFNTTNISDTEQQKVMLFLSYPTDEFENKLNKFTHYFKVDNVAI